MILKDFQKVKKAAKEKNIDFIINYLLKLDDLETFRAFKHQKILYNLARHDKFSIIAETYLSCASKIPLVDSRQESLYIDFVIVTSLIIAKAENEITLIIESLKDCHLFDVLLSLVKWMYNTVTKISKKPYSLLNEKNLEKLNNIDKASYINTVLHKINAELVDLNLSVTRLIYYLVNNLSNQNTKSGKFIENKTIEKLVTFSSCLEAIYYRVDQVSYDELSISNVDFENHTITLEFQDINLQIARQTGIRRLIAKIQKEPRSLRFFIERYKEITKDIIIGYINFYQSIGLRINKSDEEIIKDSFNLLSQYFSYEDEILLLSHDSISEIDAIYLMAVELLCQINVLSNIVISDDPLDFGELLFGVNFKVLEEYLSQMIDIQYIKKAFPLFYSESPIKLLDLKTKPLFFTKDGEVLGVLSLAQYWASTGSVNIRRQIIKGDYLGKKYGEVLEEYLEQIFTDYKWNILGRQIKIKINGSLLTDVDLIVENYGLILLIQIKGISESRVPYEYWKCKIKIQEGVEQAKLASEYLTIESQLLKGLLTKRNISLEKISVIQPIVITPDITFNGWNISNIPVICLDYILSILNGAKLEIVSKDQKIIETNYFLSPEPTADEIINLLKKPYYQIIESMNITTSHKDDYLVGIKFEIPELLFNI